jgi:hypothetical protein
LQKFNYNLKCTPTGIATCCILSNFCIATKYVGSEKKFNDKPNSLEED